MKKHLIVSLAIILSLLIIGCGKVAKETGSSGGGSNSSSGPGTTPPSSYWGLLGNSAITENSIAYSSDMFVFADNEIYYAYQDETVTKNPTVVCWDGSSWNVVGTKGLGITATGNAYYLSMDVVSSTEIYLAYVNALYSGKIVVMRWDGSSWSSIGSSSLPSENAKFLCLKAVNANEIYLSYSLNNLSGQQYTTYVSKWDGGSWNVLGSGFVETGISELKNRLDVIDSSHVYLQIINASASAKACMMQWNGSSWVSVGTPSGFSGNQAVLLSTQVISPSEIYAGYSMVSNSGITVKAWDGVTWNAIGADVSYFGGTVADSGNLVDMHVVASNNIYVCYLQNTGTYVKKWNGNSWQLIGDSIPSTYSPINRIVGLITGKVYIGGVTAPSSSNPVVLVN